MVECDQDGSVIDRIYCAQNERCDEMLSDPQCLPLDEAQEIAATSDSEGDQIEVEPSETTRRSAEMTYQDEDDEGFRIRYGCSQSTNHFNLFTFFGLLLSILLTFRRYYIVSADGSNIK